MLARGVFLESGTPETLAHIEKGKRPPAIQYLLAEQQKGAKQTRHGVVTVNIVSQTKRVTNRR